jgi:N-acetylneuraminate synthase
MRIGSRDVGPPAKPFIIAEIAQTHDGSLGNALAFVELAKECGADAIKFQTHIAAEESTPGEPWRVPFSKQDDSRYTYWERVGFKKEHWRILKARADELGLVFLSSPFSIRACEWLQELDIDAWKLASGEVHNRPLVDWIASTRKPVIISSGLSTVPETRALAQRLLRNHVEVAILHCTTKYPTPADEVGLNVLHDFADLPVVLGLSDHSGTIFPGIVATYLGASIIEVHLAFHRKMFGPDVSSSLVPEELAALVRGTEFAWRMRQNAVDKDMQLASLARERSVFGRSLVAARDIAAGENITEADLLYKKPGGGVCYEDRHLLVGKRAAVAIPKDEIIRTEHVE